MARTRKTQETTQDQLELPIEKTLEAAAPEKLHIDDMPLTTFREYRLYNEEARRLNKNLKVCRYPIKPCPIELHSKERIVFGRNDQPSNALPVYISNSLIHFSETLIPGKEYNLPQCVVSYLAEKGTPVWKWYDNPDGTRETGISNKEPRFALRTVYAE